MENVYVMKRAILLNAVVFFAMSAAVYAQERTDVIVRSGEHEGVFRLVFESDEAFIKKTNVNVSGMQINVEFPSTVSLIFQKDMGKDTVITDKKLTINNKEPFEIKLLRLSSPPRLVVDILYKEALTRGALTDVVISQKIFAIDPGHGGYDFGIMSNFLKEKDITLSIAKDIEGALMKKGKNVYLTRRGDQFVSLRDRAVSANQKAPDIFLSVHISASENFSIYSSKLIDKEEPTAKEQYAMDSSQRKYSNKSRILARAIGKAIREEFNLNVIHMEMYLPLLDSVAAPAVLIEIPSFEIMTYDLKTRLRVTEAIVRGLSYYGW